MPPSNYPLLRNLTKDFIPEVEAIINGKIPFWLNGTLFRNGPGRLISRRLENYH
jgi:carotenoid cleavage dioxygenase-like enzyme